VGDEAVDGVYLRLRAPGIKLGSIVHFPERTTRECGCDGRCGRLDRRERGRVAGPARSDAPAEGRRLKWSVNKVCTTRIGPAVRTYFARSTVRHLRLRSAFGTGGGLEVGPSEAVP